MEIFFRCARGNARSQCSHWAPPLCAASGRFNYVLKPNYKRDCRCCSTNKHQHMTILLANDDKSTLFVFWHHRFKKILEKTIWSLLSSFCENCLPWWSLDHSLRKQSELSIHSSLKCAWFNVFACEEWSLCFAVVTTQSKDSDARTWPPTIVTVIARAQVPVALYATWRILFQRRAEHCESAVQSSKRSCHLRKHSIPRLYIARTGDLEMISESKSKSKSMTRKLQLPKITNEAGRLLARRIAWIR